MCSSWGVVMKMKSIPEGFPFDSAIEENSQPMEADKEFHVIFWNYFIIGTLFYLSVLKLKMNKESGRK
ncbi:unnamed protein product, partial [Vitis vinifera]|uniref:Uncharacterized protein n=1 Tax=Vitis vinifera TaxID=29760 RepID=D7TUF0_VITVI